MTDEPEARDQAPLPEAGAGRVLLHWIFITLLMTALIGGAALLF
ncbi:hypothetical protein [Paracoccus spongiarum]|uniref:Uncharacterized protein n=1 Tax=Paracoccus spongiarum TaxID=3064387 RepID=A0ABT9JCL9_9RHOB|nr:hypothetical protein [Paracoccus sp. 2205BS29-5]MDP5307553.1 hypothetical protein [Paracoccus sp. 2205BS29-5]